MIYTTDEKQKLDTILAAFHSYIQAHTEFDILYSEKIGYVRMSVEAPEEAEGLIVIGSAEELLDVLFNEVTNDVLLASGGKQYDSPELSEDDAEEVRRRIAEIVRTIGSEADADEYLDLLDEYLENYPDNGMEDRWPAWGDEDE